LEGVFYVAYKTGVRVFYEIYTMALQSLRDMLILLCHEIALGIVRRNGEYRLSKMPAGRADDAQHYV
jgi:hypothetical protein